MLQVFDSRILGLILISEPCESDIRSFYASVKARSEGRGRIETQVGRMILGPREEQLSQLPIWAHP